MSEPLAKVARIMPELAEKDMENVVEEKSLPQKDTAACESNVLGHGAVMNKNGDGKVNGSTNGHVNGTQKSDEDGEAGDGSELLIKRLSEDAKLPQRGSLHAAGLDLYSAEEKTIPAKGKELVPTKLAITVPVGSYGRIAPRSGLAWKHFIDVGAGVIDHDYTGEVGVLLFNFSDMDYQVKKHERVAQLVIEKIFTPKVREVEELPKTIRGATGYGASGKH